MSVKSIDEELKEGAPVDLFHVIDIIEEQEQPVVIEDYVTQYFDKLEADSKRKYLIKELSKKIRSTKVIIGSKSANLMAN